MKNMMRLIVACAALVATPAMAEVAVVVSAASSQAPLTKDEVAQIFLGKSNVLTPVDQAASAPVRAEFYKKVTDKELSQVKALWSKLVFTGKASAPKEVASGSELKKALSANPKAVGYIDKSEIDATVRVVYTQQ